MGFEMTAREREEISHRSRTGKRIGFEMIARERGWFFEMTVCSEGRFLESVRCQLNHKLPNYLLSQNLPHFKP